MRSLLDNLFSFSRTSVRSQIRGDEQVVFFKTDAAISLTNPQAWHVPIHGWIFQPQISHLRKKTAEALFYRKYALLPCKETQAIFDRRINLFLSDNERGKKIAVRIAELTHTCAVSAANGHFHHDIEIPCDIMESIAPDGFLPFQSAPSEHNANCYEGQIRLVPSTGISVISDIDDTVKITDVTQRKNMIQNTFFQPFKAVPGMADAYSRWSQEGATVHFVSSCPWYLYPELDAFFKDQGFPFGSLSMKVFRFRDPSLLNLFKSGNKTKPAQITGILKRFPLRKFILIGDSGEQDPEVYRTIKELFPNQIRHIWIRNITQENMSNLRMQRILKTVSADQFSLFTHAEELPQKLQ